MDNYQNSYDGYFSLTVIFYINIFNIFIVHYNENKQILESFTDNKYGIEYTKVGKHRRIKYEDVIDYKKKMKEEQKKRLIEMMHADEDLGRYDS